MDSEIANPRFEIEGLAREMKSLRLIDRALEAERIRQNRFITGARQRLRAILFTLSAKLARSEPLKRADRTELSRLFVIATLLEFDLKVFSARWIADEEWFEQAGAFVSGQRDVTAALATLDERLSNPGLRLATAAYHALAVDLHGWADRLSPEATTASGWLGAADDVSRELRFRAHQYHTRELWAQLREPRARRPAAGALFILFLRVFGRKLYGVVSGYGLRARRFVASVVVLVLAFAATYWALDASAGCSSSDPVWLVGLDHLVQSLCVFTTVGLIAGPSCTADVVALQRVASVEALSGYLMLGVLISVFWMAFHESVTGISGMRLAEQRSSATPLSTPPTVGQTE
jgi:hypothetical protein